jgi:hypothetical protein
MRHGNDANWLKDEAGNLVGLNLGADFTAEHEWGIKKLYTAFGVSDDPAVFGIKRRAITAVPTFYRNYKGEEEEALVFDEFKPNKRSKREAEAVLVFAGYGARKLAEAVLSTKKADGHIAREFKLGEKKYEDDRIKRWPEDVGVRWTPGLKTAWDGDSFGVHVRGKENVENLRAVYTALVQKDLAIWLGGGGVFQQAGLILGILSKLPAAGLETMRAADENTFRLNEAANKTGIYDFLKAAGKDWYYLGPRKWRNDKPEEPMFFLNPREQSKYDGGWFTLDDLRLWAEDKGPVVKVKEEVK